MKTFSTTQRVCRWQCGVDWEKEKKLKARKALSRKLRRELKENDRGYQLKRAQRAFNAFIRERDKHQPCVSCDRAGDDVRWSAGHYKTVGAYPELRFEELNCHKQCWFNCNKNRSGNIVEYRPRLIERIGIELVEWLEGPHERKNYSLDEIKEKGRIYKNKLNNIIARGLN